MKAEELRNALYSFRNLWCQNIDLSTIDEFIEEYLTGDQAKLNSVWVKASEKLPKDGEYFAAKWKGNYWEGFYSHGTMYLDPNTPIQQKPDNLLEVEWLDESNN